MKIDWEFWIVLTIVVGSVVALPAYIMYQRYFTNYEERKTKKCYDGCSDLGLLYEKTYGVDYTKCWCKQPSGDIIDIWGR